jgi:hypothetical protein
MGGLWAYVWAESEEQIAERLDAEVLSEPPDWLLNGEQGVASVDIDHPPDWLLRD